jgi:hypothetical protein
MKKHKKFLLLFGVFIMALSSSAFSSVEEISDKVFWKNAEIEISEPFEENQVWKVIVEGTYLGEERDKELKVRTTPKKYRHFDEERLSREMLEGKVVIGGVVYKLENLLLGAMEYPYEQVGVTNACDNGHFEDVFGRWKTFNQFFTYERVDGSEYTEMGDPIFQLKNKRVTKKGPVVRVCKREWEEFTQWKYKTRHEIHYMRKDKVYRVTYRRNLGGGNEEEYSREAIGTVEVDTKQNEEPNCGQRKD